MRTENIKSKRTLKGKTQSIETSVIRLTRTKAMPISDTTKPMPVTETHNSPYTPETEIPHTPLSRASSLPANMTTFAIERDPLPIGSDLFQTVLKEINDETVDIPSPKPQASVNVSSSEEQSYQPPKLKKTSSLRRTQSERIPGRSVRFGGFEIEGTPSPSLGLSFRLSSADFDI